MMGAARSASLRDVAPLNAGTARLFWRGALVRHPALALPGNPGALAPCAPPFTPHSANCNAACANCNASLPAPPVKWPRKRHEPSRKERPMFTELCIAFYTVMTLGIASAFLFTHAQQAK